MAMAIDERLAADIRKCELQRLRQIGDTDNKSKPQRCATNKEWFELQQKTINTLFGKALYHYIITGEGDNTEALYFVLEVIDNGKPLAYEMNAIRIRQSTCNTDVEHLFAGITKNAFESSIQLTGELLDTENIEYFLKEPMMYGMMAVSHVGLEMVGKSICFANDWGLYIYSIEDALKYLNEINESRVMIVLNTLIPVDRLDDTNHELWKKKMESLNQT